MSNIRVLIADDHTLVRESLVNLLNASGVCQVVAEAADGLVAVEKALLLKPDVAIIDISMPASQLLILIPRCQASHSFSSFQENFTYEKANHGNQSVKVMVPQRSQSPALLMKAQNPCSGSPRSDGNELRLIGTIERLERLEPNRNTDV